MTLSQTEVKDSGESEHLSTRQYALIVKKWVASIGLDPMEYGTHTMRRTKVALIYQKTKNLPDYP